MKTLLVALFVLFVGISFGATIYVPDDYTTIQAAINASSNGDYIRVKAGTYNEDVVVNYKDIYLISQAGHNAIIAGTGTYNYPEPTVKFVNCDGYIDGFKIINGTGEFINENSIVGGGVYAYSCEEVTVKNCLITENTILVYSVSIATVEQGSAIYIGDEGQPVEGMDEEPPDPLVTITDNVIEWNGHHEDSDGAVCVRLKNLDEGSYVGYNIIRYNEGGPALYVSPYGCDLDGNQFYGNEPHGSQSCDSIKWQNLTYDVVISNNLFADGLDYYGSSVLISEVDIYNSTFDDAYIVHNTFVNSSYLATNFNSAYADGGLFNNIFWCEDEDYQIVLDNNSDMPIDYNDIYDGEDGIYCYSGSDYDWGDNNIESDPIWKDESTYDYRIKTTSPCKEAGGNAYQKTRHDWLMDTRKYGDDTDIGCDEWDNSVPF
ncbi:MAG: right-handed parallel beta-helix repeat-containing protein [Planctomycetota bacterium]|jgi:hypothetical protein